MTQGLNAVFLLILGLVAHRSVAASNQLTLAWDTAPRTIDPRYTIDAKSHYLADLVHCSLINFGEHGETVNDLAASVKWAGPTKLTITLKRGIKFSDGSLVTAKDVKATYDFFQRTDVKKPSPMQGSFKNLKSTKAVNAQTLEMTLTEPDASFPLNLIVGILPQAQAKQDLISQPDRLTGCGPFTLSQVSLAAITLKRNKNYSLGKPAKLEQVTIKIVKDEFTRYAKLAKGEIDFVQDNISREKVAGLAKASPQLKVVKKTSLNTTYLGFNMRDKVVGNPAVRRAIAHAIDRQKIIDILLKGMATPATTMLTPADKFIDKSIKQVPYNPAKARQLLKQAGLKTPIALSYKTTTNVTRINIAKAIASQLKRVGFKVTVQPLEWGKFKADVEAGRVQMWSLGWVGFKDPNIFHYAFATESAPPNGGNRGWYSNKALDNLLAKARATTDQKKRYALYAKVQKLVAKDLPYVFLWHEQSFAVMNKGVENFKLYADGRLSSLREVSVKR